MTLLSIKLTRAPLVLALASVLSVAQVAAVQAQIRFSPPTPPDPGEPSDQGPAGGRRGDCDKLYAKLTALVPSPRPNLPDDRWGLTVSDRPTVWFDVPTGMSADTFVEWRLRNAQGKTIYKTIARPPKTQSGVISLSIPATVPFAIGTYEWDLAIFCNDASDTAFDVPAVRKGRIQRIAAPASLQRDLAAAKTPIAQAKIYAKHGIWYDALTTLGTQTRSSQAKDQAILEAWRDLLRQQKLESKVSAKITACCTFK